MGSRSRWARLAVRAALVAWITVLIACHTLPPAGPTTPWTERRTALQELAQFTLRGQLAAAKPGAGFSAGISWQQQSDQIDAWLRSPLGLGGAHLQFDGVTLRLTASDGVTLAGDAAHDAVVGMLGFEPPLASLRYWLLGVPDPSQGMQESLDPAQRLASLKQSDWQVDYGDYTLVGAYWLPGSIVLKREVWRLKLRVAHWQLP